MATKTVCDVCGKDIERFQNRIHHPLRKQYFHKDVMGTPITVLVEIKAGVNEFNKGDLCSACTEYAVMHGEEIVLSADVLEHE